MPDPTMRQSRAGHESDGTAQAAAQEAIKAREQGSQSQARPDAEKMPDEEPKSPTITLKDGTHMEARVAAFVWQGLETLLSVASDEFRSLLALAQGRPADANPAHFESLWAEDFLEKDQRTIKPEVTAVLLNCYKETHEGPVIAPLKLWDAADKPAGEDALEAAEQRFKDFLSRVRRKGEGPLME